MMKIIHARGQNPKMSNRVIGNNSKVLKQMQCLSKFQTKTKFGKPPNKLEIICIMT
jgi:hypothetical protein